jgi:hypothetical protein
MPLSRLEWAAIVREALLSGKRADLILLPEMRDALAESAPTVGMRLVREAKSRIKRPRADGISGSIEAFPAGRSNA